MARSYETVPLTLVFVYSLIGCGSYRIGDSSERPEPKDALISRLPRRRRSLGRFVLYYLTVRSDRPSLVVVREGLIHSGETLRVGIASPIFSLHRQMLNNLPDDGLCSVSPR